MPLLYKEDWEETKQRYLAWWRHEDMGRCALAVIAPRDDAPDVPEPPQAETVERQWYDLDHISRSQHYSLSRTYFGGEALPVWNGGYPGHVSVPSFLGCPFTLDRHTGWHDPILMGDDIAIGLLGMDRECSYWRFGLQLLRRGVQEAEGKALVSLGAIGGCGDTLAAARGTQRLLYDCLERPDQVRAAEEHLMDLWFEVYDTYYEILRETNEGSTCWFTLWSPGKFYCAQNDFSYSIGPQMFRDLFLPVLRRQTDALDHCIYHVDGVAAFVHVDALCELPGLQALQILPGAGKPGPLHYVDVLKKVQAAGKNLHISIEPEEVEPALAALSSRGLFIHTWTHTEQQARSLLKNAERWSKVR